MKKTFFLRTNQARAGAIQAVKDAQDGYAVTIAEPTRNADQNAKFHSICSNIARSGMEWAGKKRTAAQWKVLLVSGHAVATKEDGEIVPGLEREFVSIRESTALMSVKRSASLITYALAFADMNGIELSEPMESVAA
jgi:NinB protein